MQGTGHHVRAAAGTVCLIGVNLHAFWPWRSAYVADIVDRTAVGNSLGVRKDWTLVSLTLYEDFMLEERLRYFRYSWRTHQEAKLRSWVRRIMSKLEVSNNKPKIPESDDDKAERLNPK